MASKIPSHTSHHKGLKPYTIGHRLRASRHTPHTSQHIASAIMLSIHRASGMSKPSLKYSVSVAATSVPAPAFAGRGKATDDRKPRQENVAGDFYVDHTCIDTFTRIGDQSAVHAQPNNRKGRVRALQALLSCPTFSIHVNNKTADELQEAQEGLPMPVPGTSNCYSTGWRSIKSYACESYLIVRPEGNIMVDAPRFNPVLARRITEMGGIRWIFLTHKDDVGDHALWVKHSKAERILHADEVVPDTEAVEHKLTGEGPWELPGGSRDVTLIFTPGHTSGHVCLYYAPDKALFTGDHLSAAFNTAGQELHIFKDFNWFSVPLQLDSVRKLLDYDWLRVLPGHGRPVYLKDAMHRLQAVNNLLELNGVQLEPAVAASTGSS